VVVREIDCDMAGWRIRIPESPPDSSLVLDRTYRELKMIWDEDDDPMFESHSFEELPDNPWLLKSIMSRLTEEQRYKVHHPHIEPAVLNLFRDLMKDHVYQYKYAWSQLDIDALRALVNVDFQWAVTLLDKDTFGFYIDRIMQIARSKLYWMETDEKKLSDAMLMESALTIDDLVPGSSFRPHSISPDGSVDIGIVKTPPKT